VVEAELRAPTERRRARRREQAEVVVVGQFPAPQERGPAGDLRPHLKSERLAMKVTDSASKLG